MLTFQNKVLIALAALFVSSCEGAPPSDPATSGPVETATQVPVPEGMDSIWYAVPGAGDEALVLVDDSSHLRIFLWGPARGLERIPARLDVREVAWMPRSREVLVAFGRPGRRASLAIVNLDGDVLKTVIPDARLVANDGLAVTPDGRAAILSARRPNGTFDSTDLYRVDLRTGEVRNLTSTPTWRETFPSFVGGAARDLIFARGARGAAGSAIVRWDIEASSEEVLTPPGYVADRGSLVGDTLFFSAYPREVPYGWHLYRMSPAGGSVTDLGIEGARLAAVSAEGTYLFALTIGTPWEPGPSFLVLPVDP